MVWYGFSCAMFQFANCNNQGQIIAQAAETGISRCWMAPRISGIDKASLNLEAKLDTQSLRRCLYWISKSTMYDIYIYVAIWYMTDSLRSIIESSSSSQSMEFRFFEHYLLYFPGWLYNCIYIYINITYQVRPTSYKLVPKPIHRRIVCFTYINIINILTNIH